jgi:hypothetical protein
MPKVVKVTGTESTPATAQTLGYIGWSPSNATMSGLSASRQGRSHAEASSPTDQQKQYVRGDIAGVPTVAADPA